MEFAHTREDISTPSDRDENVLEFLSRAINGFDIDLTSGVAVSEATSYVRDIFISVTTLQNILEKRCLNDPIRDLVHDTARVLGYIANREQYSRLMQNVEAMNQMKLLVKDIETFINQCYVNSSTPLNLTTSFDRLIDLQVRLEWFRQQYDRRLIVRSTVNLEALEEELAKPYNLEILATLGTENASRNSPVDECLDGTRQDLLFEIDQWVQDIEARNILWLTGSPGVGKSAIASTVVKRLHKMNRLGSSFFFHRRNAADVTPSALWRTVAIDLAHQYPRVKKSIIDRLRPFYNVLHTGSNLDIFHQLVREPLTATYAIPTGQNPVIVIDALDECEGLDGRQSQHLIEVLSTLVEWAKFPTKLKIIVTSRKEDSIEHCLRSISHVLEIPTSSNISQQPLNDTRQFLHKRFHEIASGASLSANWPGDDIVEHLAHRSGGIFEWSKVATEFVADRDHTNRLSIIMDENTGAGDINSLYSQTLTVRFPNPTQQTRQDFRSVLGTVILAKESLSISSLSSLLSIKEGKFDNMFRQLGFLIRSEDFVNITHQSFSDFLISEACPPDFHINIETEERRISLRCLQVMEQELRFNICDLESSFLMNTDVQDIENRINRDISNSLRYASWYWASHLEASGCDDEILDALQRFMQFKFLFWLEVMSLTHKVDQALKIMDSLENWMNRHNQDASMALDSGQFLKTFMVPISMSVPHIYISALPLTPRCSFISKWYSTLYPGTLDVIMGGLKEWREERPINRGRGYGNTVTSFAFSSECTLAASGSYDGKIRIWSMETGELIAGPIEGHDKAVDCLAFSPDGKCLASGSEDMLINFWNPLSGDALRGPLVGTNNGVYSLSFSPDSRHLASASYGRTIRIWDIQTGQVIGQVFTTHGDFMTSIAYSSDGRSIAAVTDDGTISTWDAVTGKAVAGPFIVHTDSQVNALAFSPSRERAELGPWDRTVNVWHTFTGDQRTGRSEGFTGSVEAVAFSSDFKLLAAGSLHKSITVWDVETGNLMAGPFEGHMSLVISLAFLPGDHYFASGSLDKTIRIWKLDVPMDENVVFNSRSKMDYGWILDSNSNRLFWVPPSLQDGLMRPHNTLVIGDVIVIELGFEKFECGARWSYCRSVGHT